MQKLCVISNIEVTWIFPLVFNIAFSAWGTSNFYQLENGYISFSEIPSLEQCAEFYEFYINQNRVASAWSHPKVFRNILKLMEIKCSSWAGEAMFNIHYLWYTFLSPRVFWDLFVLIMQMLGRKSNVKRLQKPCSISS